VPKPYGDSLILDIVRESGGTVVDLPDEEILASLLDWTRHEGLLLCPEGACATAAYDHLISTGFLKSEDRVVLFNTGSGLKYIDAIAEAMHLTRPGSKTYPQRTPVGGIITPQ
jgi:threonine synthase